MGPRRVGTVLRRCLPERRRGLRLGGEEGGEADEDDHGGGRPGEQDTLGGELQRAVEGGSGGHRLGGGDDVPAWAERGAELHRDVAAEPPCWPQKVCFFSKREPGAT